MAIVDVAPRAAADVDTILVHLHGRDGLAAADRQQAAFKVAARRLALHPEFGRSRPDIGPDLRSVLTHPYVLIDRYDRARDTVSVLRVLHGRRRLALDAL